ncbi:MAG: zinc ribbon domain-containing protein [Anaerolineaceae bacterium]|nr:zinc ribbon domain-containing protein [Anaerolineaceae bacterium]
MESKFYHGNINPKQFAKALHGYFNRNNLNTKEFGSKDKLIVQIATRQNAESGGDTAIPVIIEKVPDGVSIQIGKQSVLGVAASLGISALATIHNPLNLLNRIDDIAQDIENLQLKDDIWDVIQQVASKHAATMTLSENLRTLTCEYCLVANPVSEPNCIACGAPLGNLQPETCLKCGYTIKHSTQTCPNCKAKIARD